MIRDFVHQETTFPKLPEGYMWGDCVIGSNTPDIRAKGMLRKPWSVTIVSNIGVENKPRTARVYGSTHEDIDLGVFDIQDAINVMATMFCLGVFSGEVRD